MNPGFELLQEIHRFFDTYLKGEDTGLAKEPRIHYFTMNEPGGGHWHAASSWPVAGVHSERWWVGAKMQLDAAPPALPTQGEFTVRTDVDCPQGGVGPFMQPCLHPGQGLTLLSSPLMQSRTVTGNPVVKLQVRVDRTDANIFAYLIDMDAQGKSVVITEGRLKASLRTESEPPFRVPGTPWHRAYAQDDQAMKPGEAVSLHFGLLPTSYRIPATHRVGLVLMGADYRERLRDASAAGTTITLLSSPSEHSWLDLPTVNGEN
jgi:hypothetical protein